MTAKVDFRFLVLVFLAVSVAGVACRSRTPRTGEETSPEALASLMAEPAASRVNFYVSPSGDDQANGSAAHPWKTLEKAAAMAAPGVAVHVAPGDYWLGDAELKTETSGTATARIRYVSDRRWGARLRSTKTGNSSVWWNRGDY